MRDFAKLSLGQQQSVLLAPHSSRTWLLIAILQGLGSVGDRGAGALKMSYLTSPAVADVAAARLSTFAVSTAIADPELKDLARGDIRLILTHRPDMKEAIVRAYRRGSADGKTYIQDVVRGIIHGSAKTRRDWSRCIAHKLALPVQASSVRV